MDAPKKPPKALLPTISLRRWKPDQQALDDALGNRKSDKKSDRGTGN